MKKNNFLRFLALFLAVIILTGTFAVNIVSADTVKAPKVAAIDFSKQGETSAIVTKKAFPGGSTFSFDAYVPSGVTWWGVVWTTDSANTSIYDLSLTGTNTISSGNDTWSTYTYTLPNDGKSYYLYFAGECSPSKWAGKTILIDNFTVTNAGTEIAYDSFDTVLNAGLFKANPEVVSLIDYDYNYASITISNMSGTASTPSFITKEAYPAQSTITFDAFVPNCGTNDQWWGVKSTTDPKNADIYDCWTNPATCVAHAGEWFTYSFNIGGDAGQQRYIYLGGNKGSNWNKDGIPQSLLIKNVKITAQNGTVLATEDFSGGLSKNIFKCQSLNGDKKVIVSVGGESVQRENVYAAVQIDKIAPTTSSPADFITKNSFSGGTTVSFDACTPANASWWAISYTDNLSNVGLYKWTADEGSKGQSYNTTGGAWKHYSFTLPDDGGSYYVYFVGAKGEWNNQSLLIDNVLITSKDDTCIAFEDFSGGIIDSIFNASISSVTDSRLMVEKDNIHSASILVDNMEAQSFITKKAYPGGSTVTFDAFLPKTNGKENKWWGACFTTNPAVSSVYNVFESGKGKSLGITEDKWVSYSFTLPDNGNDYYFHLGANIGNWSQNGEPVALLVDNFTVVDSNNYLLAKEDFESGLENSIFNCEAINNSGKEVVSLYEETLVPSADINGDGAINIIDLIVMKKYLANYISFSPKERAAADINGSNTVDSVDLILLTQYILFGIKPEDQKNAFIGENGNWWIDNFDTGISAESICGSIVSLSVSGENPSFEYATPAKNVEINVTANYSDGSKKRLSKAEYEIADISSLTYKTEGNYVGEVSLRADPNKKTTFNYSVTPKKSLKVLFIGNSFSECTVYLLHDVATSLGIDLLVEDMYIAGCPIDDHYYNLKNGVNKYKRRYWNGGTWAESENFDQSLETVLASEKWDFISVQQASAYSGVESSYSNIYNFIDLIKTKLIDKNHTRFVFNMTWAYDIGSPNEGFANYGNNQATMYQSILSCTQKLDRNVIDIIIPNGTAVQNNRTSYIGDVHTYDGTHLTYPYGDFIASLTAIKSLTGISIDNITYTPSGVDAKQKSVAIESANNAFNKPYEVTESAYNK